MAVLSTIIGRGTKASRPAAGTAGALYLATDEGILYRDNGSTWDSYGYTGIVYAFSTTTGDADPGSGVLRFDNATPGSVTKVFVDDQPANSNADLGTVWSNLTGARLLITQADDPAKYILVEVTAATDDTGYFELGVTVDSSGTLPDDGALLNVIVLGGGGGGSSGSAGPWWTEPRGRSTLCRMLAGDSGIALTGRYYGSHVPSTISGTAFDEGNDSGIGDVHCTRMYDTSPAASQYRGIRATNVDVTWGAGHYYRASVYVADAGDQDVISGWLKSTVHGTQAVGNSVRFQYIQGTDTNWQCWSDDGTTAESTDSGVAFAEDTWFNLEIHVYNDGGTMTAKFWINGTLVATHTTRVPAAATETFAWYPLATYFQSGGATATYDADMYLANDAVWYSRNADTLIDKGYATSETS